MGLRIKEPHLKYTGNGRREKCVHKSITAIKKKHNKAVLQTEYHRIIQSSELKPLKKTIDALLAVSGSRDY